MALIGIIDLLKQAKNKKLQSLTIAAVNGFFEDIIHTKVNVEDKQIYSDLKMILINMRKSCRLIN